MKLIFLVIATSVSSLVLFADFRVTEFRDGRVSWLTAEVSADFFSIEWSPNLLEWHRNTDHFEYIVAEGAGGVGEVGGARYESTSIPGEHDGARAVPHLELLEQMGG
jgi:hypothetical protein